MSDASSMALRYVEETTFGQTPSGPPKFVDARFVNESLRVETSTTKSAEIRSDRQVPSLQRTGLQGAGDVAIEMSYASHDDWLEALLLSAAWTTDTAAKAAGTTVSFSTPSTIGTTATWDNTPSAGDWINVAGSSDNDGRYLVVSATSNTIVVAQTLTAESAGATITVTIMGEIANGTTFRSFAIEKEMTDLSNEFVIENGFAIETGALSVVADQLITGTFGFLGKTEAGATSTAGDGSPTAANANTVMNAIDNVLNFEEGSGLAEFSFTNWTLAYANNLRARLQAKSLGPISIGKGIVEATGTLQAYFETKAAMDKYRNFTGTSLAMHIGTAAASYVLHFPNVNFTGGQQVAGGQSTDIIADLTWEAVRDATLNRTVSIHRFGT